LSGKNLRSAHGILAQLRTSARPRLKLFAERRICDFGLFAFYAGMAGNAKDKDRVEFTRFKELK